MLKFLIRSRRGSRLNVSSDAVVTGLCSSDAVLLNSLCGEDRGVGSVADFGDASVACRVESVGSAAQVEG